MEYEDDFDAVSNKNNKLFVWWNRVLVRLDRFFRWPRFLPPKIWLPEDAANLHLPIVKFGLWGLVCVTTAFVRACIVLLYRGWYDSCATPLNAFVVVAAVLSVSWGIALFFLGRTLSQTARLLFVLACVLVLAWVILGIIWLAQSASGGCMASAPMLFGVTVVFVVVYGASSIILLAYFGVQAISVALLQKRVIKACLLKKKKEKGKKKNVGFFGFSNSSRVWLLWF